MNGKQCKRIRQDMKDMGFNPSERAYEEGSHAPVYLPMGYNEKGEPVYSPESKNFFKVKKGKTTELSGCGRKVYQEVKKSFKKGEMYSTL